MTTLLKINTSLHSDDGQSSRLANRYVERWQAAHPDGQVVVRDLAADPVPHLTAERFQAFLSDPATRTEEQARVVAASDELIAELRKADVVVLGLPMYNFGIPSTLKSWIDHVARAGETFRYTADGPEGLVGDRPVLVFAARGGQYHGTPKDVQSTYIEMVLNFIGIRDIQFIYAEGLNLGDAPRREALDNAFDEIDRLAA